MNSFSSINTGNYVDLIAQTETLRLSLSTPLGEDSHCLLTIQAAGEETTTYRGARGEMWRIVFEVTDPATYCTLRALDRTDAITVYLHTDTAAEILSLWVAGK